MESAHYCHHDSAVLAAPMLFHSLPTLSSSGSPDLFGVVAPTMAVPLPTPPETSHPAADDRPSSLRQTSCGYLPPPPRLSQSPAGWGNALEYTGAHKASSPNQPLKEKARNGLRVFHLGPQFSVRV